MPTFKDRKCYFHKNDVKFIDYKNVRLLRRFMTQYFKIVPKYYSGTCLKHQKQVAKAIKTARIVGLLPFTR
ncbi:30S ribosomal protein S18 [Candidatus Peregrinibacteria bacterium]|nr:30S ribosomal protein S18 [Candidatus Peregrinibacteria bacterium]